MLNPDEPTVRWAQFGRQVQYFKASDIGQFLYARAEKDAAEAMEELAVADPYNAQLVQSLQNKLTIARNFIRWLEEAIAAGESAIEELKHGQT